MPILRRHLPLLWASCVGAAFASPGIAAAETSAVRTGGASVKSHRATTRQAPAPAPRGHIVAGLAVAPPGAPPQVVGAIAAANRIATSPYRYGGGHRSFEDSGYDCSGSVSYALGGAGLLLTPLDSSSFMRWGARGRGTWITVYTNPGHAYVVIAGLRFDTSGSQRMVARYGGAPGSGPRWRGRRSSRGYRIRHYPGL